MIKATAKQLKVLRFIADRINRTQPAPSVREICAYMEYRSTRAAHDMLAALIRKGYLTHDPGCARTLRLLPDPSGTCLDEHRAPAAAPKASTISIPILGSIAAGLPDGAIEYTDESLPLTPEFFGIPQRHRAFALRVRGDSMTGRHFLPGDLVICDADSQPRHGDAVAAMIDGEFTLKTLVMNAGTAWLRAENAAYPDLHPAAELTIQGVACGVIRTQAA